MEMHQVRYFLAVAEQLNFTRAAECCNVAQSSLTRAIKLLEAEFGGPLFHRERQNTHLTELGNMVHPHLKNIDNAALSTKMLAQEYGKLKRTPLRLGIMSTVAPDEFIDLIGAIRTRHPGIELHLGDSDAKSLRSQVIEGQLELAIYALPGGEPDERTHVLPLFRERMVMAVHTGHRLANQTAVRVKEMDGENYIHRNNCEFAGYADGILAERGVTCTPKYWSDRDDWTLSMVAAGLGFGFLPANSAKHPGVVALPIIEPEFWRVVNLVSVRGRPHSPAVGALVQEALRKEWFGQRAIGTRARAE
ncbi:MAG: LysR family transcriptional regulator [Methylobacteriaceae bacterium]|nr:LysR family transcriptional regulator [Methylobacteriaceae bacterium]